jgi:hypothetical protein
MSAANGFIMEVNRIWRIVHSGEHNRMLTAVGAAWSLLGPHRYGQAMLYLFQKYLLSFKHIIVSIPEGVFDTCRKRMMVRAQSSLSIAAQENRQLSAEYYMVLIIC